MCHRRLVARVQRPRRPAGRGRDAHAHPRRDRLPGGDMAEPLSGLARDRVRPAARRPVHRHAARRLRRRRDQDRGARRRRRDARLGPPAPQRPLACGGRSWPATSARSRSICASRAGQEIAAELAATADIVLENFRPGTMEKWGLGPEDVHARNPRCIYARVSGYGQTGRYATARASPPPARRSPACATSTATPTRRRRGRASASATRSPPSPPSRASCSRCIARETRRRGPGRRRGASSTRASRCSSRRRSSTRRPASSASRPARGCRGSRRATSTAPRTASGS